MLKLPPTVMVAASVAAAPLSTLPSTPMLKLPFTLKAAVPYWYTLL